RGVVPDAVVADVGAALTEALPALATLSRVRCHRDYTPRNWLAREGGELVVLDFEHARPDLGVADLERLWGGEWRREPALREAFLAGYGRDLTADEEETLRRVAALGGLTTGLWARGRADAASEAHGRGGLRRLGLAVTGSGGRRSRRAAGTCCAGSGWREPAQSPGVPRASTGTVPASPFGSSSSLTTNTPASTSTPPASCTGAGASPSSSHAQATAKRTSERPTN